MFCPECGVKCESGQGSVSGDCYDCPDCQTHWTHDGHGHGGYIPTMPGDTCLACEFTHLPPKTPFGRFAADYLPVGYVPQQREGSPWWA